MTVCSCSRCCRSSPTCKCWLVCVLCCLLYVHQTKALFLVVPFVSCRHLTGILAKVYEVYKRHYAPAPDANADANQNAADANNNNNANANAGAGRLRGVAAGLARLDFTRVLRISSDRGFVQDVKYFFVGFLLSLVPAWHPQPFQGAAAPPVVQDMPDVAEMPVQGI